MIFRIAMFETESCEGTCTILFLLKISSHSVVFLWNMSILINNEVRILISDSKLMIFNCANMNHRNYFVTILSKYY